MTRQSGYGDTLVLKKVLVPLDGSALAEQALGYAADLCIPTGATLVLVRVAYSHTLPGVDPRERKQGAIAEAEQYLARTASALVARGYACETRVPFGHAAECIVEEGRLADADLIVMTTHGRTGPDRIVFGSVAEAVVARATVPVLVTRAWLPPRHKPFLAEQPIFIVPLDGSAFAETAIEPAVGLTDDVGGVLLLTRAIEADTPDTDALEYLEMVEARLAARFPDLTVLTEVRSGHPAEIIDEAYTQNGASLVLMATHGRGGLVRSVLGSVAGEVIHHGRCPVVVVRPVAHAEIDEPVAVSTR
jgi:nucleotide-binding universal stress UspA family protein